MTETWLETALKDAIRQLAAAIQLGSPEAADISRVVAATDALPLVSREALVRAFGEMMEREL